MTPIIARRERALDLFSGWRERSENGRRWEALFQLLDLRALLREHPEAAATLPPGFDVDQHLGSRSLSACYRRRAAGFLTFGAGCGGISAFSFWIKANGGVM